MLAMGVLKLLLTNDQSYSPSVAAPTTLCNTDTCKTDTHTDMHSTDVRTHTQTCVTHAHRHVNNHSWSQVQYQEELESLLWAPLASEA